MDLHGADVSRKEVLRRFASALDQVASVRAVATDVDDRLAKTRRELNAHARTLHQPRPETGRSIYDLYAEEKAAAIRCASQHTRFRGAALTRLSPTALDEIERLLRRAGAMAPLFLHTDPSPWTNANLPDPNEVLEVLDAARRLRAQHLPAVRDLLREAAATEIHPPSTLSQARQATTALSQVVEVGREYDVRRIAAGQTAAELADLLRALAPLASGLLMFLLAWLFSSRFRKALALLREYRRAKAPRGQLFLEARRLEQALTAWRGVSGGQPPDAFDATPLASALQAAWPDVDRISGVLKTDVASSSFGELEEMLDRLLADSDTARAVPAVREIEYRLAALGADAVVHELRERKVAPSDWPSLFRHAWLVSCLEAVEANDPTLRRFAGRDHDGVVTEFQRSDLESVAVARERIRRAHAERVIETMNKHPEEQQLVKRECAKRSRHLAVRTLLNRAPNVLTTLCPCWMASPLSVAQLMDTSRRYFDVVVFDEASQILPEDAVPAILRGEHVVVAGDQHQLPPTTFFAGSTDDADDEESATAGFESLLNQMCGIFAPWPLEWHYRSLDERLIAFSNRHIYSSSLVTFPGVGGPPSVSHVLVPWRAVDGEEDSSSAEVEAVVGRVLEHAAARPGETLGVITMGIKHRDRIQHALDQALGGRRDLEAFFDERRPERFFVKNLEQVQGDERDAIILSVGYGKDRSGRLPYRFGPLLTEGGYRRLNVAITRARRRMLLVSAFTHHDMEESRSTNEGVRLLRGYLEFAGSDGAVLDGATGTETALNAFEMDIKDALERVGLSLVPQVGVSRYRIDFGVLHPRQPGRYVLALECDGASYHSAATARDRDRLRQQQLESLGWRFHRIWSTDWRLRRGEEIQRAVASYEEAVRLSDESEASQPAPIRAAERIEEISEERRDRRSARPRGPRPQVVTGLKIEQYRADDLRAIVQWILSDGLLRTDDDLLAAALEELGFRRRGKRIDEALREAIRASRRLHA